MKYFLPFALLASFGATCAFARNINAHDAELRQFIRLLDKNGNNGVSLEELKEKLNELDRELGNSEIPASSMVGMMIPSIDQNRDNSISLEDFEAPLDAVLGEGFRQAIQMMDKNFDSQISQSEINSFADQIPRGAFPVPLSQVGAPGAGAAIFDTNMDSQISYGEFKNMLEEVSELIVGLLDRNGNGKISLDEVKENVKSLMRKAIDIVDLDGDNKISAEELTNALNPKTLSEAFMNLLDANDDGEVRYEEIKSLDTKYGDPTSPSAVRAELNDIASAFRDAIRGKENVKSLIRKAIDIVDLDGDNKISAQELTNALNPNILNAVP